MRKLKHVQPILQTDPRLPESLGIKRWGCRWRSLTAMIEIATSVQLEPADILELYNLAFERGILKLLTITDQVREFKGTNAEGVANLALEYMVIEGICTHIGDKDEIMSWINKPHRTDYTLIYGLTLNQNKHYLLGDTEGVPLWDPSPDVGVQIGRNENFLRFRVDL